MNTYTVLTIKTDKKLKAEAKKVAEELGVPLSTVVNAFLRQFARDRELTISASYKPSPYLEQVIAETERERSEAKKTKRFATVATLVANLDA